MSRFWCPVCDQGWVVSAKTKRDGEDIWVCEECEVLWIGSDKPDRKPDDTFSTYLEAKGIQPLWSEIAASRNAEVITPWQPAHDLPPVLYCESVLDTKDGLQILLASRERDKALRVIFDNPFAYQNVNESYRSRTWTENPHRGATLLTIANSRWMAWLVRESMGLLDENSATHYAIYTPEDCIDVVSRIPPRVETISR